MTGVTTVNLETASVVQTVLGNRSGTTVQIGVDQFTALVSAQMWPDYEAALTSYQAELDTGFVNFNIYPDLAAGLAATPVGGQFGTRVGTEIIRYQHAEGQISVELARYPTADSVALLGMDFATPDDDDARLVEVDGQGQRLRAFDKFGFPMVHTALDFRTPWDDASVEIMTGDGHRIAALDGQGCRLPNIDEAAPMMPTVIGSSLIAVGNGFDGVVADLGGLTAHSVAPKNAKSVRAVVDLPLIGPRRAVAAGPAGKGFLIPDDPQILYCIIGLGQSLCAGVSSASSLMSTVTPYPDDALMFDLATGVADVRMGIQTGSTSLVAVDPANLIGFKPLTAVNFENTRGETPLESCAFAVVEQARALGVRMRTLAFFAGRTSSAYSDLKKGTLAYSNMITGVTRAKALADARGWKLVVLGALVKHGESDAASTTYQAELNQWQADVETDVRAITGQTAGVPFILPAPSSIKSVADMPEPPASRAALAMLRAHISNPKINLAGPDYRWAAAYDPTDYLHFTGQGYAQIGQTAARALLQATCTAAQKSRATYITAATATGATVVLTYSVPYGTLALDSANVRSYPQSGFRFVDSTGEKAISNVVVSAPNQVTLTLASASTGTGKTVYYGTTPHLEPRQASTVPGGNLRDSSGEIWKSTLDGQRLDCWAEHQAFTI